MSVESYPPSFSRSHLPLNLFSSNLSFFTNKCIQLQDPTRFKLPLTMKRTVRPLISALLFSFLATTLICRLAIHRRTFSSTSTLTTEQQQEVTTFNETLLEFASIDPGEFKFKHEVDSISDYDNTRRTHRRHFNSMDKPIDRRTQPSKYPPRSSPVYRRYWSDFKSNLRLWTRHKSYDPNIMLELVKLVKNPIDSSVSNKRYSSCAVVGNSGTLLNNRYGEVIDRHEVVIRLNNARTERFEDRVGSKTNISFINSNILHLCARRERCRCYSYGETVAVVMYVCQPIHVFDYTVCKGEYNKGALVMTDPRFDVLCARIVKYYSVKRFLEERRMDGFTEWSKSHEGSLFHYSSGMQAVMLAVGVCEEVSLFGFGKVNATKHHYHTNQKAELKLHDYEAEYDLYRDLEYNPRGVPFLPEGFKFPLVKVFH